MDTRVHSGRASGHARVRRSKVPVPTFGGWPMTMLADGLFRSSKSPYSAASVRKAAVVSYEALSRGETWLARPVRLNGL